MSERIDHAAEARKCLVGASIVSTEGLLRAQVHAPLALAEQQRIANLIALWVNDAAVISDARFDSVSDEIREALGL